MWKLKKSLKVGFEKDLYNDCQEINKFSQNVIKGKNKSLGNAFKDESGTKTFDLFTLYKTHDPSLTDNDMKIIALNFIIAGRDTTRMLLSWFFYEIGLDKNKQIKQNIIDVCYLSIYI